MFSEMILNMSLAQAAPSAMMQLLPLFFIFFIFYFLLIRPQQKRQKALNKLVSELKKGDKIVTAGGILGTVTSLQNDYVVIKTGDSDQTKMEVLKSSITGLRSGS